MGAWLSCFRRKRTPGHHAPLQLATPTPDAVPVVASADECFGADSLIRPVSRLKFAQPVDSEPADEVMFFRDGRWSYGELRRSALVQFNYCMSGTSAGDVAAAILAGGTRHAVIRAVLGVQGATYVNAALARHLGLRTVALGGSGRVSPGGARGPVSLLAEPGIQIQLLDTDGGPLVTYPAPLVFVMDGGVPFDLHISLDVCGGCQVSSAGYRVKPPPPAGGGASSGAQESLRIPLPRLVPRRWQKGEPREQPRAAPIWVANNTFDEALALVAARAGVRARLAAAAAGRDADAAAARATGELERQYGEGTSGRLPGGSPAVAAPDQPAGDGQGQQEPQSAGSEDPAAGGLPPLPPALRSARWAEVAATHLPAGDTECVVCAWSLTGAAEAGAAAGAAAAGGGGGAEEAGPGPGDVVVQLGCRHTFHELCVRQMMMQRQSRSCPLCRMAMC